MAYADYTFYINTYLGIVITDNTSFQRVSERSSEIIDAITNNAITTDILSDTTISNKIKKATCALAEQIYYGESSDSVSSGGNISSIKAGEETVTYNNSPSSYSKYNYQKDLYKSAIEIISKYLAVTNLLYMGL